MSKKSLGLIALLGAMMSWGPAPVVTKLGLSEIPPYSFAFVRFLLALLIVLPFFFAFKHHRVAKADILRFVLVGLFGSGLNVIFFMTGISKTTATSSAAIFATVPLVNALAASFILREKPTFVRALGIFIGLIGSFIIAIAPILSGNSASSGDIFGNVLILFAVFSWVAYIIGSKELLERYSPLTVTTYSFISGATVLLPLTFYELINNPTWYLKVDNLGFVTIAYAAIFASVVPFFLYQWGTKYTSAFSAGIVTYLNPVLAAIWAAILLHEYPTTIFLLGTFLIFAGVFLATVYEALSKKKAF